MTSSQSSGDMRTHKPPAIRDQCVELNKFERGQGEALTECGGRWLDGLRRELFFGLQLTRYRTWKIGIRLRIEPKPAQPVPIIRRTHFAHRLDHADIARHLKHSCKIHDPIALAVVIANRPTTNGEGPTVVNRLIGLDHTFLQR